MEYTKNYKLPQWVKEDRIQMEDFNEAMTTIDQTIKETSYYIGSYTGNGKTMAEGGERIELGFRPRFIIISKGWTSTTGAPYTLQICTETPSEGVGTICRMDGSGFTVALPEGLLSNAVRINLEGTVYSYLALR